MKEKTPTARSAILGVFIILTVALGTYGIFTIGQNERIFGEHFTLNAEFDFVAGIQEGSTVRVQGIEAGVVESIVIPISPGEKIKIVMRLDNQFNELIRKDAVATLMTQGIVGSKVVEITPGTSEVTSVKHGDTISAEPPVELTQIFKEAYETSQEIKEVGTQLSVVMSRLEMMTKRVEEGKGSLGKFVMNDEAHEAALKLLSSGDKLMTHTDESLVAMRRAWPFKDYLSAAGVNDATDLLFRPGSSKDARVLETNELFLNNKSILTEDGRTRLNTIGKWLSANQLSGTEIVIACYQPSIDDADLAKKLSHERALAVKDYLIAQHSVNKIGWFTSRDVVAAGFGNASFREVTKKNHDLVEISLFTPQ